MPTVLSLFWPLFRAKPRSLGTNSVEAIHPRADGERKPCDDHRAHSDYVAPLRFVRLDPSLATHHRPRDRLKREAANVVFHVAYDRLNTRVLRLCARKRVLRG
jgi:hypothetical protein